MTRKPNIMALAFLSVAANYLARAQQAPPPTILTVDVASYVEYQADIYDPSK